MNFAFSAWEKIFIHHRIKESILRKQFIQYLWNESYYALS